MYIAMIVIREAQNIIVIGIVQGIGHDCYPHIVCCDVKSNNILVGKKLESHTMRLYNANQILTYER
jgi:hypothetical protein